MSDYKKFGRHLLWNVCIHVKSRESSKFILKPAGLRIYFTFNQIGIHDVQWISINMVKQSGPEMRKLWLEEIEGRFGR